MNRTAFFLIGVLGFVPMLGQASAQDPGSDCWASKSPAELHQCANRELLLAEQELDSAYNDAQSVIPDPTSGEHDMLQQAQNSWSSFRKSQCDFEGSLYRGDPLQPVVYLSCWQKLTAMRTQALRGWIDDRTRHP